MSGPSTFLASLRRLLQRRGNRRIGKTLLVWLAGCAAFCARPLWIRPRAYPALSCTPAPLHPLPSAQSRSRSLTGCALARCTPYLLRPRSSCVLLRCTQLCSARCAPACCSRSCVCTLRVHAACCALTLCSPACACACARFTSTPARCACDTPRNFLCADP